MSPPAESVRYDTLKPLETSCRTCTWNETTSAKRDRSIRPARNCPPLLSVENLSRNNGPSLFVDHHRRPITRRDGSRLLLFICFIYIYIYPLYRTNPLKSKLTLGRRPLPKIFSSVPPLTLHPPVQDFLCSSFTSILSSPTTSLSPRTRFHIDHDDSQRIIPRKNYRPPSSGTGDFPFFFFLTCENKTRGM